MYVGAGAMMGRSQSGFTCRSECQRRFPETLSASRAATAGGLTRPQEEHKQGHLAGTHVPPPPPLGGPLWLLAGHVIVLLSAPVLGRRPHTALLPRQGGFYEDACTLRRRSVQGYKCCCCWSWS